MKPTVTGHFHLGDLDFTYEAESFEELAACQEIQSEFERAERALRRLSGSKFVKLTVDDVESGGKKFKQMRLRVKNNGRSWTIDIGSTDNNPWEIYPRHKREGIQVYDYEKESRWAVDKNGEPFGDGEEAGGGSKGGPSSGGSSASRGDGSGGEGSGRPSDAAQSDMTPQEVGDALKASLDLKDQTMPVAEVSLGGDPLVDKLRGLASYCDRSPEYCKRVLASLEGAPQGFEEITVGTAQAVIDRFVDSSALESAEEDRGEEDRAEESPAENLPI